jgi:hypothetical protein
MTALQLARAECANFEHDGACLGTVLGDDGSVVSCTPRPSCLLAERKRCAYFEECVAPMQHIVTEARRAAEIQSAVREYRKVTKQGEEIPRECPDCGCPVVWRKRYCPACSDKRRKATFRRAYHNGRQNGDVDSTVKPETPSESLGNSRGSEVVSRNPYEDSGCSQNSHLTVEAAGTPGLGAGA